MIAFRGFMLLVVAQARKPLSAGGEYLVEYQRPGTYPTISHCAVW